MDAIINQLKLKRTTHNPCQYKIHYNGNKMMVTRQRDDLEAPVDSMTEETYNTKGESPNDSNNTSVRVLGRRLAKGVSVPTFAAEMTHGPHGSTLQAIKITTGCLDLVMGIESGTEAQVMSIHVKEGDAGAIM